MARAVKIDLKELKQFSKQLENLQKEIDEICISLTKEIAARLLSKVIKRTPVGVYKERVGGILRRGWSVKEVVKEGNNYIVEVFNPVEYGIYVEYGHRTQNHKSWVQGKFMLTISTKEINEDLESIINRKLKAIFKEKLR